MILTRRQFVAGLATGGAVALAGQQFPAAFAGEARAISWPSRVVQLPPDGDDLKPPVVTALRLHAGGQWLATAGDDHIVRVWNLETGKLIQKLNAHIDWVRSVDYAPNGSLLASAGNDRQIIFWRCLHIRQ